MQKSQKKTGGFHRTLAARNSGFPPETVKQNSLGNFSWFLMSHWRENRHVKFYAITVSPHDHHVTPNVVYHALFDIITECKTVISAMYVLERSPTGKYHAHGILASKDYSKFLKVKKHPTCQFHTVKYTPGNWISYCLKDGPTIAHYLTLDENKFYEGSKRYIKHEQLDVTHSIE